MSNCWIQTYSGVKFDLSEPKADMVSIKDIAHALSQICRFTGHSSIFYSVAEHCCLCYDVAPAGLKYEALLHDAPEAYYGDISTPLKKIFDFNIQTFSQNIDRVVRDALHLVYDFVPPKVKEIDGRMLATERIALLPKEPEWPNLDEPYPKLVPICWDSKTAEEEFLVRYEREINHFCARHGTWGMYCVQCEEEKTHDECERMSLKAKENTK